MPLYLKYIRICLLMPQVMLNWVILASRLMRTLLYSSWNNSMYDLLHYNIGQHE